MSLELPKRLRAWCWVAFAFALIIAVSTTAICAFTDDFFGKILSEHETPSERFSGVWRDIAVNIVVVDWALRLLLLYSVARLLWILGHGDIFTRPAARAALMIGRIQMTLAIFLWLQPTLLRLLRGLGYDKLELMISMTGPISTALLFGVVLLLLARIYALAVEAVEENRQFV